MLPEREKEGTRVTILRIEMVYDQAAMLTSYAWDIVELS